MKVIAPKPDKFIGTEHHRLHSTAAELLTDLTSSGTTAQRPTTRLYVGRQYFDTSLAAGNGMPIWYNPASVTGWRDATGADV